MKREESITISHVPPLVASESAIVPIRSVGRISAIDGFPKESHARCGQPLGFPHPPGGNAGSPRVKLSCRNVSECCINCQVQNWGIGAVTRPGTLLSMGSSVTETAEPKTRAKSCTIDFSRNRVYFERRSRRPRASSPLETVARRPLWGPPILSGTLELHQ
jgi:hypothetical protein